MHKSTHACVPQWRKLRSVLAALILAALCVAPNTAIAQDRRAAPVTIELQNTTLGQVLTVLMKQVHASYTLDARLSDDRIGAIRLEKVAFRFALEAAIKAGMKPATYNVENGIYRVIPQETPVGENTAAEQSPVHVSAATPEQTFVKLNITNGTLYDALKLLFNQTDAQYTLDPGLRSITITAHIEQPFNVALETLLKAAGSGTPLTYNKENGVYRIIPKETVP